jgi:hypothetical protein
MVRSASRLATALGVRPLVVGLTGRRVRDQRSRAGGRGVVGGQPTADIALRDVIGLILIAGSVAYTAFGVGASRREATATGAGRHAASARGAQTAIVGAPPDRAGPGGPRRQRSDAVLSLIAEVIP